MTTDQSSRPANSTAIPNKWLKILGYTALTGLLAIGIVLIYVSTLPDDFRYQRSALMQAPPESVFPLVNNFHEWGKWSPWENIDPNLKRTYEGAESGKGAVYSWVGNAEVGEGKMEIEESKPSELISIKLEFFKPFAGVCPTKFQFEPSGDGTKVTWTMEGKNHFIAKAMCLLIDMDKMIGKNFEDGLEKLNKASAARLQATKSEQPQEASSAEPKEPSEKPIQK